MANLKKKLKKLRNSFKTEVIDRNFFTRHELHLNKKGELKISERRAGITLSTSNKGNGLISAVRED